MPASSITTSAACPLNVIVPMGGLGSRFASHGYKTPKPLIPIAGRPMLEWLLSNLKFVPGDTLFLAVRPELETQYNISTIVRSALPSYIELVTIKLTFSTRGAAETLYIVTQYMSDKQLARRTISLDCDTIYFSDALTPFRKLPPGAGCSLYFKDDQPEPIFSYITFEDRDRQSDVPHLRGGSTPNENRDEMRSSPSPVAVTSTNLGGEVLDQDTHGPAIMSIAEKVRISSNANTGGYGFGSASLLQKYLERTLEGGLPSVGEYYTSSVISRMLADRHKFYGIYISDFTCVGTVPQLNAFLQTLRASRLRLSPPRTFCFDMFGTLFEEKVGKWPPAVIPENVSLARELMQCGHTVKVLVVQADPDTRRLLHQYGLDGVCLCEGKPEADRYLGNGISRNPKESAARQIGWATLS